MKMGLYARVSTYDQQTLALQRNAMVAYAQQRRGAIVAVVEDVGSGGNERLQREELMRAARRREIDAIVVWRLDRWGRSLADLVSTLQELYELGVGFISLSEALDFATPTGRAMAGMLRSLPRLSAGFFASGSRPGLRKPADGAPGMDGRRRSPTRRRRCGNSMPRGSVSRPLRGGWGLGELRYGASWAPLQC